jgi:hypothetical protein
MMMMMFAALGFLAWRWWRDCICLSDVGVKTAYVGLKNELLHCPVLLTRQIEFF